MSGTPGGTLAIESAPSEAVIGTIGTIVASWAGLDPDTEYLAGVSHSNEGGPIGLTLLEIATG